MKSKKPIERRWLKTALASATDKPLPWAGSNRSKFRSAAADRTSRAAR